MGKKILVHGKATETFGFVAAVITGCIIIACTAAGASAAIKRYEYDSTGRLVKAISSTVIYHYGYDAADNLSSESVESIISGDVNLDMTVSLSDAVLSLQLMAGIASSEVIHYGADLDGDGKLGMSETLYILKDVAGL